MAEGPSNDEIADILKEISKYYVTEIAVRKKEGLAWKESEIRKNVYANAATAIKQRSGRIRSIKPGDIKGIGKGVCTDINEIIDTGKSSRLKRLKNEYSGVETSIAYFTSISGIGPKRALDYTLKGYLTVDDIPDDELTNEIRLGIKHHNTSSEPIPRKKIADLEVKIKESLEDLGCKFKIAGSYRRKEATSGDIDLLVTKCKMSKVVKALKWLIDDVISQGEFVFRGYTKKDGYRIDIKVVPKESFPFALMHYTGSFKFNQLMRSRAIELGYLLNEYGIFLRGQKEPDFIPLSKESEIFDFLNVVYIPPSRRLKTITSLEFY